MSIKLRRKKLKSGEYSLYLDIYNSGRRQFEFLDFKLKGGIEDKEMLEMANSIRAKRELELASDGYDMPSFKKKVDYYEYAESHIKHLSPGTLGTYKNMHVLLKELAGDKISLNQINTSFCQKFSQLLLERLSPNSARTYLTKLKTILNHAVNEGIIGKNPARTVKIKGTATLPKYLTITELQKLFATPCDHEESSLLFMFSCFTGLRWSDLISLTWSQINLEQATIAIKEQKTGHHHIEPLTPQALFILKQLLDKSDGDRTHLIFNKLPVHQTMNHYLEKWSQKAIGKSISIHVGRHTFATMLLTSGVDLYTVSKLLGHRGIQNTQIYAQVVDEKKVEAVKQLGIHTAFLLSA